MKNWKILLNVALLGAVMTFLGSCGEEEPELVGPSIVLSGSDLDQAEFAPGEEINVTVDFTTPQGLSGINWYIYDSQENIVEQEFYAPGTAPLDAYSSTDIEGTVNLTIPVPAASEGEELRLEVEVADVSFADGATETFTFTVISGVETFQAVLLQAPTEVETSETFFSTNTGETYSVQEVNTGESGTSANIDFGYYYGATNLASLASPSAYRADIYDLGPNGENWGTLNETTFRSTTMSQSQFNEVTSVAQIHSAFNDGTAEGAQKTKLEVGDVLAFRTDADKAGGQKYGLIYVSAINPGDGSDKSITLEIVVED